jgi:hypothetical protein
MFVVRFQLPITLCILLSCASAALGQTGTVRGYPAGAALQQTPYYQAYYPVQYGYAYPPTAQAYAQPQTAYYAPAPATAAARPTANYTLSPAGGASAGSEAYAYYGQSTPLNYVPPTYAGYQTRMVQVPVTYYRPYTVYQPGMAMPMTCQRAVTGTVCQPATRHRWFSCLDWLFHHKRPCGAPAAVPIAAVPVAAVPAVVPRAVCYGNTCAPQCGTPYYNTVPPANVVPVIPGTVVPGATIVPGTAVPSTVTPGGIRGIWPPATVPPPGTRTIVPGTIPGNGADIIPRINPGTSISPPSSFPGTSGSGFSPSGANYSPRTGSSGSGRKESDSSPYQGPALTRPAISEPSLGPRRSVQPVPDPAAGQSQERSQPSNRAPALIGPGDRTAAAQPRTAAQNAWDVVPAKWPEKARTHPVAQERGSVQPVSQYVPAPREEVWDDTLWKSAK